MARKRILIIDDEDDIREVATLALETAGDFDVTTANGGRAGVEAARNRRPDLILLDVMMPQVDGWEMLQRVQERHGVGAIPVIMFSGKVDEQDADEAASRGAQGFIGKPFNPQELIDQTKQLLPT